MGLNLKEQQLIDLLTATNNKLDSIIVLLGGVPPTSEHTLDDLYQVMSDIHLDTMSIDQKLLRLTESICAPIDYLPPLVPVEIVLNFIWQRVQQFYTRDDIDWNAIMGEPHSIEDNVLEWLSGIGHVTGDATTTILGRLTAIENYSKCACGGMPPDPLDPLTCSEQYVSISQQNAIGSYEGLSFVQFPSPPPSGIIFTDDLDIGVPNCEISASPPHIGARMYALSNSANVFQGSPGNVTQYPTNQWVTIETDSWTLAPCVPNGNDLKIYICDDIPPFLDCVTRASEIMTVTYPVGVTPPSHTRYYTPLSDLGLTLVDSVVSGGQTFTFSEPDTACSDDMIGVRVELISGPFARVIWINTTGGSSTSNLTSIGQQFTIPEHTTFFAVDNWQTNDISPAEAYTVELCPSGPA